MKHLFIIILSLAIPFMVYTQNTATISGYVYDIETSETIIDANIFIENKQIRTTTNSYGYYSLALKKINIQ